LKGSLTCRKILQATDSFTSLQNSRARDILLLLLLTAIGFLPGGSVQYTSTKTQTLDKKKKKKNNKTNIQYNNKEQKKIKSKHTEH
jgi:hypothetical protein